MEIRRKPPNPKVRVQNLEYAIPHEEEKARNVLEEIIWHKDIEINNFKKETSLEDLMKNINNLPSTKKFLNNLQNSSYKPAIIAEIKKASPSKGTIRECFNHIEIAQIYEQEGAACISVLTDKKFFQGSFEILSEVRKTTNLPLLCKDFIISAYQIYKARLSGADAILLIAAILKDSDLKYLKKIADKLGMDVLIEVHNEYELNRVLKLNCFNLIGINNRDLKTFKTDLNVTFKLLENLPETQTHNEIFFISESGIKKSGDLKDLRSHNVGGVLIGERLMSEKDIKKSFRELLNSF